MATATKKIPPSSSPPRPAGTRSRAVIWWTGWCGAIDAIYRFLASVKLAVISLGSLAATLAYATFFEKLVRDGGGQRVHLSRALFRDPAGVPGDEHPLRGTDPVPVEEAADGLRDHARRAAGPAGRLVLQRADVGRGPGRHARGGRPRGELVRIDYPVIRVWEVDPHTQQYSREFDLPFLPGAFSWGPGQPAAGRVSGGRLLSLVTLGLGGESPIDREVLTKPGDPFQVVVKEYLDGVGPGHGARRGPRRLADGPDPRCGSRPPACPRSRMPSRPRTSQWFDDREEVLPGGRASRCAVPRRWSRSRSSIVPSWSRTSSSRRPAGTEGRRPVPIRRQGGQDRRLRLAARRPEGQVGRPAGQRPDGHALRDHRVPDPGARPGSACWATTRSRSPCSRSRRGRRGGHAHGAGQPADGPQHDPVAGRALGRPEAGRWRRSITWSRRSIDPKINGRFGQIDVLAGPDRHLYLSRLRPGQGGPGRAASAGPVAEGQADRRVRRQPNMPMTISFSVDDYLPSGVERGDLRAGRCCPPARWTRGSRPAGSR